VCDCTPTIAQFLARARNSSNKEGLFDPSDGSSKK
jgi:hypothetical protein